MTALGSCQPRRLQVDSASELIASCGSVEGSSWWSNVAAEVA